MPHTFPNEKKYNKSVWVDPVLSIDVSQRFFAEQKARMEDVPQFPYSQLDGIASGLLTPFFSACNFSLDKEGYCNDRRAALSTAAQSASYGNGHTPVLTSAATDASIGPAFPSAQSTAASQSHVGKPKQGKTPPQSAFSTAFQSGPTAHNFDDRQWG
jgi:hypothetical protein